MTTFKIFENRVKKQLEKVDTLEKTLKDKNKYIRSLESKLKKIQKVSELNEKT